MMDRDFHNELPSCQVRIVRHASLLAHANITYTRTFTRNYNRRLAGWWPGEKNCVDSERLRRP